MITIVLYGLRYQSDYFYFYYDENGEISSMLVNNAVPYVFEKNAQGDVIGIINEDGERVVKYTYDAWGNPLKTLDADGNDVTNGAWAKAVPFRYRGYIYDTETGLYYLQSRFYDPQTGRFVNADAYTNTETGTPYSANMFAYCENNPVNCMDPTGYWHYKYHAKLCKKNGFKGYKYTIVRDWSQKADELFESGKDNIYLLQGNGKNKHIYAYLSSPFHSRGSANEIAEYLYNKAVEIKDCPKKLTFSYDGNSTSPLGILLVKYLGYKNVKEIDGVPDITVENNRAQKLLEELNNLDTADKQAQALLGLALHVVQDYYAHSLKLEVYNTTNGENKDFTCTTFSDYAYGKSNKDLFEDKRSVFPWRKNRLQK